MVKVNQCYLTFPLKKLPPKIDKDKILVVWWPHFNTLSCLLSNTLLLHSPPISPILMHFFPCPLPPKASNFDFLDHVKESCEELVHKLQTCSHPTTFHPHVPLIFIYILVCLWTTATLTTFHPHVPLILIILVVSMNYIICLIEDHSFVCMYDVWIHSSKFDLTLLF
jgi:hypothetical protein